MSPREQFDYSEKRTFFGRFGFAIGVCVVAGVVAVLFSQVFASRGKPQRHKSSEMVMIRPVTSQTPPPPPPQQIVQKQQMTEQTVVNDQDIAPADQPPEDPAASLGTNITGNGPADGFGLGRRDTGIFSGQGGGGGQGGTNPFGSYFGGIKQALIEALRQNPLTRSASFNIKVRIWADLTGRITKARLVESTGDPAVDQAIKSGVLVGRQLPDTPEGMRMPVELHLTACRPN
jgi:TonB family protein